MGGKQSYGPYDVAQGGVGNIVADPSLPIVHVTSGASEPDWPTTEFETVSDGGVVWTAIRERVTLVTVTQVLNRVLFQVSIPDYVDHYFQYGTIKWTSGFNFGLSSAVRDSLGISAGNPYFLLLEPMPRPINPGDVFQATVGCAKIRLACQKFNNLDNHRAFPDMPTEDRALSTPNISAQGFAPRDTK